MVLLRPCVQHHNRKVFFSITLYHVYMFNVHTGRVFRHNKTNTHKKASRRALRQKFGICLLLLLLEST